MYLQARHWWSAWPSLLQSYLIFDLHRRLRVRLWYVSLYLFGRKLIYHFLYLLRILKNIEFARHNPPQDIQTEQMILMKGLNIQEIDSDYTRLFARIISVTTHEIAGNLYRICQELCLTVTIDVPSYQALELRMHLAVWIANCQAMSPNRSRVAALPPFIALKVRHFDTTWCCFYI